MLCKQVPAFKSVDKSPIIHFSEQLDFFDAVLPQQTEYILLHFDQTSISNLNNKNKCRCLDAQLSVLSNTK